MGPQAKVMVYRARAEALNEAAQHLRLEWTDDVMERVEGSRLADRLEAEANRWHAKADATSPPDTTKAE